MSRRNGASGPGSKIGGVLIVLSLGCQIDTSRSPDPYSRCEGGVCHCATGHENCDGNPANGCETRTSDSQDHCGACGHRCTNGQCAGGQCACDLGYDNCDLDPMNGCEANLAEDSQHCGRCDHHCWGGQCSNHGCQPVVLTADLSWPSALVVADSTAYWCDEDGIESLEIDGISAPQRIYEGPAPLDLQLVDRHLYWHDHHTIWTMAASGTQPVEVFSDDYVSNTAVAGVHLYWIRVANGVDELHRLPLDGSDTPELLATGTDAGPVAGDNYVYWSEGTYGPPWGPLRRRGLTAFSSEVFDPVGFSWQAEAELRNGVLYWIPAHNSSILAARSETSGGPVLAATPLPYDSDGMGRSMCSTADSLFVTNRERGVIVQVPLSDGQPTTSQVIATNQPLYGLGIAADDQFVYWLTTTRLMRLAR